LRNWTLKNKIIFSLKYIIKKTNLLEHHHQQMLVRMWGKGILIHCWWECKLVQPLWKTLWRLPKRLNIDLPYDPAIPLLGYTQRNETQVITKAPAHPCLLQHYS
jgi:hypothetical protein